MRSFVNWFRHHGRFVVLAAIAVTMLGFWFGLLMRVMPLGPRIAFRASHSGYGEIAGFSDDGNRLAVYSLHSDSTDAWHGGPVQVWDIPSRRLLHSICKREDRLCCVKLSPDGQYTAVLDRFPRLMLLNNATGGLSVFEWVGTTGISSGEGGGNCSFSPDSRLLACNVYAEWIRDGAVVVWDVGQHSEVFRLNGEAGPLVFSPDSRLLATFKPHSGENSVTITLWDTNTGQARISIPAKGPVERPLVFSRDGHLLAYATNLFGSSEYQATITVYDLENRREFTEFDHVSRLSCSASELLVHRWSPGASDPTKSVPVDPYLRLLAPLELPVGTEPWDRTYLSLPNGRLIVHNKSGTVERNRFWTWITKMLRGTFSDQQEPQSQLEFRDSRTQDCVAKIECTGSYLLSSDESCLVMVGEKDIQVWDLPPRRPIFLMLVLAVVPALLFAALLWWRLGR
jgi:WD40 repeat protein